MKNKIFMLLVFALAVMTLSCVSASDNATDICCDDSISQSIDEEVISQSVDEVTPLSEKVISQITINKVTAYESLPTNLSAKLTSNGQPLPSKPVKISVGEMEYDKVTDLNGIASVVLNLSKGEYTVKFAFSGDDDTWPSSAITSVTVEEAKWTEITLGDMHINYRQGSSCLFYVKLTTEGGYPVENQWVNINVNGKTYTVKTNKNGNAKVYLNLKKGKYKVKCSFEKTPQYLSSSKTFKITVKPKISKGNGYWLWPVHMKSVNLKSLASKGTKHILLHVEAVSAYGKSAVQSFIKKAHKHGIRVHMWMQVAYNGGKWVSLVDDHGKIRYSFLLNKILQAKKYAKIKGVDGIHFDYVRYGGTAHKHPNAVKSVNWFSKRASLAIHKVRPNCIVSAALMPEPKMMHYYYGQDVATMSRYMDVLIPMVYKGNYHKTTSWIKSVTKTFVGQSNGAQIWTGLQSYYSDDNTKKLPQSSLLKDARAAKSGGALGVILFRIGISCNFNFNKV